LAADDLSSFELEVCNGTVRFYVTSYLAVKISWDSSVERGTWDMISSPVRREGRMMFCPRVYAGGDGPGRPLRPATAPSLRPATAPSLRVDRLEVSRRPR